MNRWDELTEQFRQRPRPTGAMTAAECAVLWGCSRTKAQEALQREVQSGRVEMLTFHENKRRCVGYLPR